MFEHLPYSTRFGIIIFAAALGVLGGVVGLIKAWRAHATKTPYVRGNVRRNLN